MTTHRKPLSEVWPFRRCLRHGVLTGLGYAVLQIVASSAGVNFEEEYGFTLQWALVLDLVSGLCAGSVAGVLVPFVKGPFSAALAGTAVLFVPFFLFNNDSVSMEAVQATFVGSTLVGSMVGLMCWYRWKQAGKDHRI